MEENVVEVTPEHARKKKRAPETWKRARAKVERYSAKMPPGLPRCNHDAENKQFNCCKLTMLDVANVHEEFYRTKNKKDQDAFLLKHCKVSRVKRRRPRVDPTEKINLMTEKRVHMLKARAFYRLLKEKRDDLVVFSFDCQKNQVAMMQSYSGTGRDTCA
ncbi:unnamed protein product [Colias eurytheme]|nr:unnamed protein product [Colias eurytheme]